MKSKIIKNASWIVGCKLVKAILTLVVTMLTARLLGPSNYGLINYAASLVTFVTPLMKLGLDSIIVYEIVNNENNEGEILGSVIILNLLSSLLCIVGIISFVLLVNVGEIETLLVCSLYSILLIFQAIEMVQYWFQAKLLSKYCALSMLGSYVIVSFVQILLLYFKLSIYWFALSYSLDYFLIAIFLLIIYKKKGTQKLKFSLELSKKMLNVSKYYIVSSLMVTIFAQTDKVMLKLMLSNTEVGYYSAALTCSTMLSFVFAAIIDSFRPSIFESKKKSIEDFKNGMIDLYSVLIYFSLIICIFTTIFAPLIIGVLYGKNYSPAISALRLVVWYTTFSYLGTARNIWIVAEKKQKYLWIINLTGAMFNIVLNYFLIPNYGIMGASFASLTTQFFTNVILGFIIPEIRSNNYLMINSLNLSRNIRKIKKVLKKN